MSTQNISAADGLVIAMLAMMVLSLSVVGLLFLCMRANVSRRNREVDDLLDEVAEDERREKLAVQDKSKATAPWERDSDWWKN